MKRRISLDLDAAIDYGVFIALIAAFGLFIYSELQDPDAAAAASGFVFGIPIAVILITPAILFRRYALRLVSRFRRRRQRLAIDPSWSTKIRSRFRLAAYLGPEQFRELLELTAEFLASKHISGAGDCVVDDDMRLLIAVQAAYLLVGTDLPCYPKLYAVVVYPDRFVDPATSDGAGAGESWDFGTVVLSWADVVLGASVPGDGKNVSFHEFAHQLDQATGAANGRPVGLEGSTLRRWSEVLIREHRWLRRRARRGQRTVMDHYGATNKAEFFAVATESFFERPAALRKSRPDLYRELAIFFRRDPVQERRLAQSRMGMDGAANQAARGQDL